MAIASKINIDVDSAAFAAFQEKFDKYKEALDKTPAAWRGVGSEVARTKTGFEAVAEGIGVAAGSMALISKHSTDFYHVTTATARHWHDLALSTGSVAKNIVGATESLLKWTGIISLVTGGAGLFGFDRLAHSVSGQRQAAMGTGGNYGARAAFLTNFRRLGDPEGILGRVAEVQSNIQESASLRILGLTPEDLKGDPADVAIKALRASAKIASADKASGRPVGSDPRLQLWPNDVRIRLRDHPEEVEEMAAKMRADQKSGRMNLSPADQKGYQDFTTRMEKASREIETIFVKGLIKLASPLGELSDATVKLVDKFTDKALPAFIKDLGGAVDWLAKEVGKPSFVEKVEGLVGSIGTLASSFGSLLGGLAGFARWLGVSTSASDFSSGSQPGSGRGGEANLADSKYQGGKGAGGRRGLSARSGGSIWTGNTPGNTADAMAFARDQLRKEGVPEANLDAAAAGLVGNAIAESQLNPNAVHDHGTGYGIYGARNDRRTEMLDWERVHGFAKNSLEGQVRQMAHSSMSDPKYRATRDALMRATDATTSGDVVERNFERPLVFNNRHAAVRKASEGRRGGTVAGVEATLRQRHLGVEYIMDREGHIFKTGGPGSQHIRDERKYGTPLGKRLGLTSANTVGMEIIADPTNPRHPLLFAEAQKRSFTEFVKRDYPNTPVYGHGEIQASKQRTEGLEMAEAVRSDRARRQFGHGHHPATIGRAEKTLTIEDHTGGLVTVVPQ